MRELTQTQKDLLKSMANQCEESGSIDSLQDDEFTMVELCKYMERSEGTIRKYIREGKLKVSKRKIKDGKKFFHE